MNAKVVVMLVCLLGIECFSQADAEALQVLSWFEKEFSAGNPRVEVFQKRNTEVLLNKYFAGKELKGRLSYLASFPASSMESSALFQENMSQVAASHTQINRDSVIIERVYLDGSEKSTTIYTLVMDSSAYTVGTWKIVRVVTPALSVKQEKVQKPVAKDSSIALTV